MNIENDQMKPTLIAEALRVCLSQGEPAFVWGPPGVGKSETVRGIAHDDGIGLRDVRAVLLDPVDVRGLPLVTETHNSHGAKVVDWAPPGFLPHDPASRGILFLDELPNAPQSVQSALLQLTLERRVGEYELPAGWQIVAAGNRETDRAGAGRLISSLADRFTHFTYGIDLDDWCLWAAANGVRPEIMGFLRFRPELLHKIDPKENANCSPRSWVKLSNLMDGNPSRAIEFPLARGKVGKAPALEFTGFMRVFRELPSPDGIAIDPTSEPVPTEPAAQYAIAATLGVRMNDKNIESFCTYLDRMPAEFSVLAMRDATHRDRGLRRTLAGIKWASKYAELIG